MTSLASRSTRPPVWRQVVVRTRDLDAGETAIRIEERWAPPDQQRQRLQLIEVVTAAHPRARLKSFADGVASFVDGAQLIVARYGEVLPEPVHGPPGVGGDQIHLFSDTA